MADSLETRQNVRLTAGDSKTLKVAVTDDAGDPVDISGTTIRYAVVEGRGGATVASKQSSITVTDAAGGLFEVYLVGDDTEGLLGEYWHEAEYEDATGDVSTVFTGAFIVRPSSV